MALGKRGSLLRRLTNRTHHDEVKAERGDFQRIEERQRSLTHATEQWRSLLHEMEHSGQSGDARYETYYRAYLEAKQRQKSVELELFNLRRGLSH